MLDYKLDAFAGNINHFREYGQLVVSKLVAGLGIEPKYRRSERRVLPLDDPAIYLYFITS